jgi:hypothetical protein
VIGWSGFPEFCKVADLLRQDLTALCGSEPVVKASDGILPTHDPTNTARCSSFMLPPAFLGSPEQSRSFRTSSFITAPPTSGRRQTRQATLRASKACRSNARRRNWRTIGPSGEGDRLSSTMKRESVRPPSSSDRTASIPKTCGISNGRTWCRGSHTRHRLQSGFTSRW